MNGKGELPRRRIDLRGERFGRLLVVEFCPERTNDKTSYWICRCDCGAEKVASMSNLKSGNVASCGCLQRELSAARRRAAARGPVKCKIDGCCNDISKGGKGMCGLHAQRFRRYGDAFHLTTEDERRANSREAQLENVSQVKDTTYRKFFGRHHHRVVAERAIGRKLLPGEHVHHIDGNKHNNDPKNLQVMTASEHAALHAAMRRAAK